MNPIREAWKEALRPLPAPKPLARTPPAPAKPEPESPGSHVGKRG